MSLLVSSPAVFLEVLTELDGAPFVLEPYQIRLLNDRSFYRLVNKARQIGFSTVIGAECGHKAFVTPGLQRVYDANIISTNQKEASAKIEIVRRLYHSIDDRFRTTGLKPELWTDSEYEISFGRPPYQATLFSQPASSAIRGGRKDIYFDEFAHIRDAKKLYQAAMPAISRGDSRITIISTPLGQSGLFYDIAVDLDQYPNYSRHVVPWWESKAMVEPGRYEEALALAAAIEDSRERVALYGTEKIKSILAGFGGDLLSFKTEYEATFVDETEAYYPWDLVISCRNAEAVMWTDWPEEYEPKGWLSIGVDLAKERDETVITVSETIEDEGETKRYVRYVKALHQTYDDQFKFLHGLILRVKPNRVTIDQTGVGQMFVEQAKREIIGYNIEGSVFTNQKKERWATQFKGDLQMGLVEYPQHPDLLKQIHGIRRTKTEANFYRFSGVHDDYYWSLILSLYGEGRVPNRISLL